MSEETTPDETPEAETDEVETDEVEVEHVSEVEGVEQEGGYVFYGYDNSNSKVDANAHSEATP